MRVSCMENGMHLPHRHRWQIERAPSCPTLARHRVCKIHLTYRIHPKSVQSCGHTARSTQRAGVTRPSVGLLQCLQCLSVGVSVVLTLLKHREGTSGEGLELQDRKNHCSSGIQAWSPGRRRRRRRKRPRSWSFLIPGGPRTPLGATFWGLFHNSTSGSSTALMPGPARTLAPGLGLPSALPALRLLHAHFGRLPWPRLLVGPASLAQDGFLVDTALAGALAARSTEGLCPLLCHADGTPLGPGARATNPKLAAVLRGAAVAPTPDLAGEALLSLLARDLGLRGPLPGPRPTLEPALQLPMPQGILSTTPSPSAGPELLARVEAALRSGGPSPDPCLLVPRAPVTPGSGVLATIDSSGSVLLLTSSLNSSFGSGHLSPSTGVLLSDLVAESASEGWACPLVLHGGSDDTEADVLGLVASGNPVVARVTTRALLSRLAGPQAQAQQQQQGPTQSPSICGQGTLLQVAAHAEHAHVSSVPSGCCTFQGF
uniref:Gamma-glutamyltransferase 6 n=1 Tax=Felis catus TaxID=9685 RepID=A0ABI8ACT1_FELCA